MFFCASAFLSFCVFSVFFLDFSCSFLGRDYVSNTSTLVNSNWNQVKDDYLSTHVVTAVGSITFFVLSILFLLPLLFGLCCCIPGLTCLPSCFGCLSYGWMFMVFFYFLWLSLFIGPGAVISDACDYERDYVTTLIPSQYKTKTIKDFVPDGFSFNVSQPLSFDFSIQGNMFNFSFLIPSAWLSSTPLDVILYYRYCDHAYEPAILTNFGPSM